MVTFYLLAAVILLSAIAVVLLPNPLHSALSLAVNLVAVAGVYALLGAHFLAAVQVIVYAGAIIVLVIFVLMLLNLKSEERSLFDLLTFTLGLAVCCLCLFLVVPYAQQEFGPRTIVVADGSDGTLEIARSLFGDRAILFQLTGVVLIIGIVGAVMLASQRKSIKAVGE